MFVPNFKILSQVVSEKSLKEKKFTDRQTHKHPYGKGKNYIPPIYFVYRGYKNKGAGIKIKVQNSQSVAQLICIFVFGIYAKGSFCHKKKHTICMINIRKLTFLVTFGRRTFSRNQDSFVRIYISFQKEI